MEQMQDKLENYRIRKRRKEKFEVIKDKVKSFLMLGTGKDSANEKSETSIVITEEALKSQECSNNRNELDADLSEHDVTDLEEEDLVLSTDDENNVERQPKPTDVRQESKLLKYTLWVVYFLFWATLYVIAIELKFGIVFLMFSALFGIYFNTRTGPKKRREISAYSVFNKNFKSIDGTLKAEQFERELIYGPTSIR